MYKIHFEEFHKKETENRWKAMEKSKNRWDNNLWKKICNESTEKHLKLLDQKILQKNINIQESFRVFCFNEAIFKHKLEKLLFKLELELHIFTDIYYDKSNEKNTKINDKYKSIYQTNLKIFNYNQNDKGKIISFFKNNGFKYTIDTRNLQDRLIFKYVTCLYE